MLTLPARASLPRRGRFIALPEAKNFFRKGEELSFKITLRERAKRNPLYRLRIETKPKVEGRTDTGIPIPIDTLGKWLWGTPGYAGNAIFDAFQDPPGVWLPSEAPKEAEELLKAIVKEDL